MSEPVRASRRAAAIYAAVIVLVVGAFTLFRGQLKLASMGLVTRSRLSNVASDPLASPQQRIGALNSLLRADPEQAAKGAKDLLRSEEPGVRLSAATIVAKAGYRTGQQALLGMLRDQNLSLGYRGMAAARLGAVHSGEAHPVIVRLAKQQTDRVNRGISLPDEVGFRWSLLRALGRYHHREDLDVALDLYKATGFSAPARAIGMFGRPEALPWLRDALPIQDNAAWIIEIKLAIARSGGEDGVQFVRELLRRGASLGAVQGEIDFRTEDPLSGRLADHLLRDLGAHPSDRQFFNDVLAFQKPTLCSFCGDAWSAIARLGTRGQEAALVELATKLGKGRSDQAIQVLAYNGAADQARALGRRFGLERSAEAYIEVHREGSDRVWFRLPADEWN